MKTFLTFILLIFQAMPVKSDTSTRKATATNDGIRIDVTASPEPDGQTLIRCILTNESKHILASASPRTRSKCFRFTLKDEHGNTIPMDQEWALTHAQPDGTNDSALARRSWVDHHIKPNQSSAFQFRLVDAYGVRAAEGSEMEVRWHNINPLAKGNNILRYKEIEYPDGTVIPAYEEENHFPNRREFVVTLPLTDDALANPSETPAKSPAKGKDVPKVHPAGSKQVPDNLTSSPSKSFDLRWLLLIVLPGLAWLLHSIRRRGSI